MSQKGRIILPGDEKNFSPEGFKARNSKEPDVTNEVKEWGALVGWIRNQGLTPMEIRDLVQSEVEKRKEEEDANSRD